MACARCGKEPSIPATSSSQSSSALREHGPQNAHEGHSGERSSHTEWCAYGASSCFVGCRAGRRASGAVGRRRGCRTGRRRRHTGKARIGPGGPRIFVDAETIETRPRRAIQCAGRGGTRVGARRECGRRAHRGYRARFRIKPGWHRGEDESEGAWDECERQKRLHNTFDEGPGCTRWDTVHASERCTP